MIIKDAVSEYLLWKGLNMPQSAKSYKPFLKPFCDFFKNINLEEVTHLELSRYISNLGVHYKPKSISYSVSILKDMFKYYPNIINPHRIQTARFTVQEAKYITEEDFILIDESLSEWNSYELRAKLIHNLLFSTGIRVGELKSIKLDDINLKERHIKIITEKSRKLSYIMWNERTHELLLRYLGERLCKSGDDLFDISIRQIQRIIKEIAINVGIEGSHCHLYRHGKAHYMITKQNASIDDVAFVLRHSNVQLTKKTYLKLDEKENISIMGKYV